MQKTNSRSKTAVIILAVIVALLFWSELIFSNLPSLMNVDETAVTLGWSVASSRFYFVLLSLFDVVGGVGAVACIVMSVRGANANGVVVVTAVTLILYGITQFITAFLLPDGLQALYWGIGVVYVLMGIGLRRLYQRLS